MKSERLSSGATVYDIPFFVDDRGAINILEISKDLPFESRRIFYTYTVLQGRLRLDCMVWLVE